MVAASFFGAGFLTKMVRASRRGFAAPQHEEIWGYAVFQAVRITVWNWIATLRSQ
jgi:hypothetical protein